MSARSLMGIGLVALLAVAGCSSTPAASSTPPAASQSVAPSASAATPAAGGTLTVWLMKGSLPDDAVAQLNADFTAAHPGWTVNYQVQNWDGIVDKLTTALASDTPPDVVELGNTQAAKFAQAGALLDLTGKREFLGGGTSNEGTSAQQLWVGSLNDSAVYNGKLFAMPFYAGDRVVIYNKDQFAAAGIDPATITSKDKLIAAAKKLQSKNASVKDYSGFYVAGQNWYMLAQMIWDRGGDLAVNENGTWKGTLESAQAMQGIQDYIDYYKAGSTGPKDNDEMNPPEYDVMSQGKAGMFIGNGWEISSAEGKNGQLKGKVGVFAIPSATDGKTAPVFLGGSDLAVAANSKNQQQALDWLKQLNADKGQQILVKAGWIPSLKSAAASAATTSDNPILKIQAAEAAAASRFTPNDPRWASVEANNPIKNMLTQILSGKASIADAAKAADQAISTTLNTAL